MLELDAKEREPGRYNNRGGQLLQEERERKKLSTKLPKLIDEIKLLAANYEQREGRPFLVCGQKLTEIIEALYEQRRDLKSQQMSARKATGGNASVLTPRPLLGVRTPMSVTKTISQTPTMKRMASSSNM